MALIALGVTGGIGAYKAVEVARGLQKRGHDVAAIMTRWARLDGRAGERMLALFERLAAP
jgi:3-polyprenyl-4-hydroxybenzoate decarboxylase